MKTGRWVSNHRKPLQNAKTRGVKEFTECFEPFLRATFGLIMGARQRKPSKRAVFDEKTFLQLREVF